MTNTRTTIDSGADRHSFSADRPIEKASEDKLGRERFAEGLASAVRGWRGRDSLVIGLYGPWGCGKSSIKNMLVESLSSAAEQEAIIADFNPWQFANREQLTEAFFDQIGLALGRNDVGSRNRRRSLVGRWRRYAAYLGGAGELVSVVRTGLIAIFVITGTILVGSGAAHIQTVTLVAGAAFFILAALLKWSSRFAQAVSDLLAVGTESHRNTAQEVKEELESELRKLKVPLLVILDDVDRLTPLELQELFQLVKVNADFPNVVYLLLCDREVVERNIQKVLEVPGREYLEKIVQVGFDVPVAERGRINQVLFDGLNELLGDENVAQKFDKTRWGNLFVGGLQPYFETLRHVNRFLSTLAFNISLFRGEGTFEVNLVDLIGLEALRVFEPEVYRALAKSKVPLTERGYWRAETREETHRNAVTGLVQLAADDRRDVVQEIVKQLFPTAEWAFGGPRYAADFEETWLRELRVCSEDVFDRYFTLAIPEIDVSQSVIERLLSVTNSREHLRAELRTLAEQDLLGIALDRLEAYKSEIPLDHAPDFVTAIFDVSEDIPESRGGMFEIEPSMHAIRIVYHYLKREEDADRRRETLRQAIRNTEGIGLPVSFVAIEEQASQKEATQGQQTRILDDEGLAELKTLCVEKIEAASEDGRLAETRDLVMVLYRWRDWAGEEPAKRFCEQLMETLEGAVRLAGVFLQRSTSLSVEDYVAREHWYIKLSNVEHFVPWETLEEKLSVIDIQSLPEEERRAVDAFQKAVARRRAGKPDFGDGVPDFADDQ